MNHKKDFKKATEAYIKNKNIIQEQFQGELYSLELNENELNDIFEYLGENLLNYKKCFYAKDWDKYEKILMDRWT